MEPLENGSTIELYDEEFTLSLVDSFSVNEFTINVFHEQSDDELTDVQDHFTAEVVEMGEVTDCQHNLGAVDLTKFIFRTLNGLNL